MIKFLTVVENDDQDRILFRKKIGNLKKDNVILQVTKELHIREKLRVLNRIVVRMVGGQERIIPEGGGDGKYVCLLVEPHTGNNEKKKCICPKYFSSGIPYLHLGFG